MTGSEPTASVPTATTSARSDDHPPHEEAFDPLLDVVRARLKLEQGFGIDLLPRPKPKPKTKAERLDELREQAELCRGCALHSQRANLVFGVGDPDADLMFIGEAPGYDEDRQGEPFVGKAGQLLTKIIEAIALKRSDVYIANILKCHPPGNRNPAGTEIVACVPFLKEQIGVIKPKVICTLGSFAAQTLLETSVAVGRLRGKFYDYGGIYLMPTYHPAYLLRNEQEKGKVWEDMKKIREALRRLSAADRGKARAK